MKFHDVVSAMKLKKFATQIDESVLRDLKKFAAAADRSISGVVTEAVAEYLQRVQVRPAFRNAMDEVLEDNAELLKRLAK
jgi:rRNA-processing protein FCF1